MAEVAIIQGIVPDYRLQVFDSVAQLRTDVCVIAGSDYFTPGIENAASGRGWWRPLSNRYFLARRLMWQSGALRQGLGARAVVIELNPRVLSTWVLCALRRILGRSTILWGHVGGRNPSGSLQNQLRRMQVNLAHRILVYTEAEAALLRSSGCTRPVHVANNSCVHTAWCRYSPTTTRRSLIYVGRLIAAKRVDVLLCMFAEFCRMPGVEDVDLLIVGSGPEADSLERLAGDLGLAPRTRFMGHVNDPAVLEDLYSRCFASVHPGYVGLSVIQSLAYGVPVVVADGEKHSPEIEACRRGENAAFFPARDAIAGGAVLARIWSERAEWHRRGPQISAAIRERYTFESMAASLVDAIASAEQVKTEEELR